MNHTKGEGAAFQDKGYFSGKMGNSIIFEKV